MHFLKNPLNNKVYQDIVVIIGIFKQFYREHGSIMIIIEMSCWLFMTKLLKNVITYDQIYF